MKKLFALSFVILFVLSACGTSAPVATATSIPPTPIPTNTPTAAFTGTLHSGIWDGFGTINNKGEIQISFIVDGAAVSRWQLSFNYCSQAVGDSQDFAIENNVFSLTIDNPCTPGEKVILNGVFTSAAEIVGTIQAGEDSGAWSAKFTE